MTSRQATPSHRPSFLRLLFVLAVIAGVVAAGSWWAMTILASPRTEATKTWVAPYVDVTLPPTYHFEDPAAQPAQDVMLGFIVADPADSCAPSWGTYYSLEAAARALDLDRRVVRLRERGGDAIVSFGGAINDELATVCDDVDDLVAAYQSVIDRYGLTALDFDIEGAAIADQAANQRRGEAIVKLQEANPGLSVWFTLPVAPHGMLQDSVDLLDTTLATGIELAGVNVMLMNYSESREPGVTMHDANVAALMATFQQLDGAMQRAGKTLTEAELWKMIGATPMIGQNDVAADVITTGDAHRLMEFARTVDIGRISYWSANRDIACGPGVDDTRASNTCSSVPQEPLEFANIFLGSAPNPRAAIDDVDVPGDQVDAGRGDPAARDDPRTSPYPLWRSARAYEADAKVVWQGRVYQAKWWTQGDQPDAPVKNVWDTPWRYLGPVLDSDREAVRVEREAADGERTRWSAERTFVAGDEVEHDGSAFRAKWWNQGDIPNIDPDQPYDHPWEYLGEIPEDEDEDPVPAAE